MTINTLPIRFQTGADGAPIATLEGQDFITFKDLATAAPALAEHPLALARALNHFDPKGGDYSLIRDPESFQQRYLARYEQADSVPFDPNNPGISDFPLPDLSQIALPEITGADIVFYATINGLGTPYRVSGPADGSAALVYQPL